MAEATAAGRTARGRLTERSSLLVAVLVIVLAFATVYAQYRAFAPYSPGGSPRVGIGQGEVKRNDVFLRGEGGDPWQYRVASLWLAEQAHQAADAIGFREAGLVGFMGFRVLQNLAIFGLAWLLYRRLGASRFTAVLGLGLVAWGMSNAFYNSHISFDTYSDVVIYLAAALLILDRRYAWVVPLAVIGALNRETSGLVPVMLLVAAVAAGIRTPQGRRAALFGVAALAAFGITTLVLRQVVGPGEVLLPYGRHFGWEVFRFNVTHGVTWDNLFETLTVVPFLALWAWPHWPHPLKVIGLAVAPAWFAIHSVTAVIAETRLLLVPYVLVLVPGALSGLRAVSHADTRSHLAA
jgi:hypothetical protein